MEGPDPGADAGLVPGQAVLGEVDGDLDRPSLGPALQAGGRRRGPRLSEDSRRAATFTRWGAQATRSSAAVQYSMGTCENA